MIRNLLRSSIAPFALAAAVGFAGMSATVDRARATDAWTVGGVAVVKPKYEGSKDYEVVGAPFAFPHFGASSGAFSFNGPDDLRFRFYQSYGFEAGVLGGYSFGRDDDDGRRLIGLGDVDGGLVLGGYVGYRMGIALFDVSYHHIVTGDDTGYLIRFGGVVEQDVAPGTKLKLRAGTTYADDNYMASYFGITAAQAAASAASLPAYAADAGLKDVFVNASMSIDLTNNWTLLAGAGYKRLVGDAADSPIVESEDQFTGSLGLTYKFSWTR